VKRASFIFSFEKYIPNFTWFSIACAMLLFIQFLSTTVILGWIVGFYPFLSRLFIALNTQKAPSAHDGLVHLYTRPSFHLSYLVL
jgi:hypothetical protein